MKYNDNNKPLVCMQTTSTCYKGTRTMTVKGILWHSTGANNPNLKRYVQPSDNATDRSYWLNLLGTNTSKNDWNHMYVEAGLNCWIGKLANGSVTTVQTMPWNYRPWGCASGPKGSCNDGWIQFEICEDALNDKNYFDAVFEEGCQITAYLCKMYNLNPKGAVSHNGVSVPVILCHQDSYQLKLGSNHGDIYHWFNKYGKTMDSVRNRVQEIMNQKEDEIDMTMTRQELVALIESTVSNVNPIYATINDVPADFKPSVQKLINKGVLKGTGNNRINLSYDACRIITMLDRANAFG